MTLPLPTPRPGQIFLIVFTIIAASCGDQAPADRVRVSGQVETTDVQVAAEVGGRLLDLRVAEGDRVEKGTTIARLDTADAELALARARADRAQAEAQLRLLRAGARVEDVRQAEAQLAAAQAEATAARAEVQAAQADVDRFEALLAQHSGSRKQRDDAVTRRDVASAKAKSADDHVRAARESLQRLRAGARPEEIDAAQARVAAADAQIATLEKAIADATVTAPIAGVVTEKLAEVGELLQPHAPIVVVTDLDHAWANVYVDEPVVPKLRLGQPATIFTDAGGPGIAGTISYISAKAEFTPRNVQTADERSKLVYRVKVSVDNKSGTLKAGMPVEAEIKLPDTHSNS
jgi:HlyD family secretion protein